MRKLIYYMAVSIDGFIADPDGGFDDFLVEGDHMPWIIEHYPETIPGHLREPLGLAVLVGRRHQPWPVRARRRRRDALPHRRAARAGRNG